MRRSFLILSAVITAFIINSSAFADDGNVWLVDQNGSKHFTCPVMKNEAIVSENTQFTDYNGNRYYFCCAGCKPTFDKDPDKYIQMMVLPGNIVKVDEKGEYFQCPVSGETLMLTKDSKFVDYQGKRYYTKCSECQIKLEQNPEKYLGMKEDMNDGMKKGMKH